MFRLTSQIQKKKKKNDEAETEVFPLKVSMESVAGPITFDTEVEMKKVVKEVEGEEKKRTGLLIGILDLFFLK